MSDFTYDNEDFTAIRVATKDLATTESAVSNVCLLASTAVIGWNFAKRNVPNSLWAKSPASLIGGVLVSSALTFTVLTWGPRSRLDDAAAHINKKYSSIISRTLNYEGIIQ